MKNFAIFSLVHTKIEFISQNFRDLFFAFCIKNVIYHTKIPNYLIKLFYPNLFLTILPTKFHNFFPLLSPLEMVSPGAARPSLSTPLHSGELSCIFNLLRGPDITRSGPDAGRGLCISALHVGLVDSLHHEWSNIPLHVGPSLIYLNRLSVKICWYKQLPTCLLLLIK